MRTVTLLSGATVDVPSTAKDWQLYKSEASAHAARALTAAITTALSQIDAHASKGHTASAREATKLVDDLMAKVVRPVMEKFANLCNPESHAIACSVLDRAVEERMRGG